MKKTKKLLATLFAVLLMLCMSVSLVGCKKTGFIPNGYYSMKNQNETVYVFTENDIRDSYGWIIDGNTAEEWVSGSCEYKAKIVEKEGKICFEGYKWTDFLYSLTSCSTRKQGDERKYEVRYNETEKSITLVSCDVVI